MPYRIEKKDSQYCVYKKSGGDSLGCHDSLGDAQDQIAAINSNEKALSMASSVPKDLNDYGDSVIIGFFLPESISNYIGMLVRERFAGYESETFQLADPKNYHITLMFFGSNLDSETLEKIRTVLEMKKALSGPYYASISGAGYFSNEQKSIYLSCDAYDIQYFRDGLEESLRELGVYAFSDHGFNAHITVAETTDPVTALPDLPRLPIYLDKITLAMGDNHTDYELGTKSLESVDVMMLEKSAVYNTNGDLVLSVIGVPFTGPKDGIADLVGDYFDQNTRIKLTSKSIEADFDHGRDSQWLPDDLKDKGFGSGAIGNALDTGVIYKDEKNGIEGRLFNVIVDRHHKYRNLIKDLNDKGYLGASMKMTRRVDSRTKKGYIEEAEIGKMSLTPTPMNENAVSLYKSFALEVIGEGTMPAAKKQEELEKKPDETTTDPAKTEKAAPEKLTDKLNKMIDEADAPEEEPEVDNTEKSTPAWALDIIERLDRLEKSLGSEDGLEKSVSDLSGEIQDQREAFSILAERVIKGVPAALRKQSEKSLDELEGEDAARKNVKVNAKPNEIPKNAPGKKPVGKAGN